jgi:hypothetical protein
MNDTIRGAHAAGVLFSAAGRKFESVSGAIFKRGLRDAVSPKELFGGPPNGTRGPRVLPRSYANKLLVIFVFINLMAMCS